MLSLTTAPVLLRSLSGLGPGSTVTDDGVGCPSAANDRLGTRLIKLLAAQMKAATTRMSPPEGCQVQVIVAPDT